MGDEIKAIETEYAGCRFRSRLEARWAVFFDALDIRWQYEVEGYETPEGRYLPDFLLPGVRTFCSDQEHLSRSDLCLGLHVEVKGSVSAISSEMRCVMGSAITNGGAFCGGLLMLGEVPDVSDREGHPFSGVVHPLIQGRAGYAAANQVEFSAHGVGYSPMTWPVLVGNSVLPGVVDRGINEIKSWLRADAIDLLSSLWILNSVPYFVSFYHATKSNGYRMDLQVRDAYLDARGARFEHGEFGVVSPRAVSAWTPPPMPPSGMNPFARP